MLVDAIADSLAEINVKTLGDKLGHVEAEELVDTMVHRQALVDTGRHTSPSRDRGTWQHTRKFGGLRSSRHTGRQTSRGRGSDT